MKKFYLLSVSLLTLALGVNAQQVYHADTILLDETNQNNQITKRYLIRRHNGTKAQFSLHFQLDMSNLVTTFSNNAEHLTLLGKFVERLKDTSLHVSAINIRGYASPDGDSEFNVMLAAKRGATFDEYINDHYPNIQPMVSSHAYTWSECIEAVTNSQIQNKEQVLTILSDNSMGERDKENALRTHKAVWEYLETNILPTMRRADLCFDYGENEIVTIVTNVPTPKTSEAVKPAETTSSETKPQPIAIIESEETGIIVELPEKEHHQRHKRKK